MPDKKLLKLDLIKILESNLAVLLKSSEEASKNATNPESKPESKYDTRGLEASYLAGAQAERANELQEQITKLSNMPIRHHIEESPIQLLDLIKLTDIESQHSKWYFILPQLGGHTLTSSSVEITTISNSSPLGSKIIGKFIGDEIEIKSKNSSKVFSIEKAY